MKINNKSKKQLNKIIVILGPTASGKSDTAIKLAKKFSGEIISSDSRQIYREMKINSGTVSLQKKIVNDQWLMVNGNVPHYMLNIISPRTDYNVSKFKKNAEKIIEDILRRGKTPILCGGTGFWIKAIVDNINFPKVKPDWKLRNQLRDKNAEELFNKLKKLDPERAKTIDSKNKVRLIRAIEICKSIGRVPDTRYAIRDTRYNFLQIGIKRPKKELCQRIKQNIEKRFKKGMIAEVKKLHQNGVSWKKIQSFGLSFYLIPKYLKGDMGSKEELKEKIYLAEKNYAKRQMTWFKRDKRIKWMENYSAIEKEVGKFLLSQ